MSSTDTVTQFPVLPSTMTSRTQRLRKLLTDRALGNRKDDWLDKSLLPDLSVESDREPVIVRRARGTAAVLAALTDPVQSNRTQSYTIQPGELLVGVLPMGSNGLGKVFPDYLDEEERHMASIANRSELSILGHNAVDYRGVVDHGIGWIIDFCKQRITEIGEVAATDEGVDQRDFYRSVIICCDAVIAYARKFADLARELAVAESDPQRRNELMEIEETCRWVPREGARNFREALQSILFVQIGLRAGMDLMSLGRLDLALQPALARTLARDPDYDLAKAVELVECFAIKTAGPLNLSPDHLTEQDHIDYGIVLGTHKWFVDQRSGVNQFLQNVVVGGRNMHDGDDTCDATHVIIQAWANVNLPTPGLYVRVHGNSPQPLLDRVAAAIAKTRSIPSVINDDMIIPGLIDALLDDQTITYPDAMRLAYDYCLDGCWEPVLHGQGDWTFQMVNGMIALECALNEGATLSSDPASLRGNKLSYRTRPVHTYDDLKAALKSTLDFFVSQSAIAMFNYYLLDEFVTPSPLYSAFLGTCLERGRDRSWGGARYALAGVVLSGLPNMVNSIAAIKKWVFEESKYSMDQVLDAFRNNYGVPAGNEGVKQIDMETETRYLSIWNDFWSNSPKYGANDPGTNEIAALVADYFVEAVERAKKLADKVYRTRPRTDEEARRLQGLRTAGGYYGPILQDRLTDTLTVGFTAGLGTFEVYPLMGRGVAASADRHRDEPVAMNNTPMPGTNRPRDLGSPLATLQALGLGRFAAGAPLDLCLDMPEGLEEDHAKVIRGLLTAFINNSGNVLSVTLGQREKYNEIYALSVQASRGNQEAARKLLTFGDVMVRAGGWQTPFITMSLDQQKRYTDAPIKP